MQIRRSMGSARRRVPAMTTGSRHRRRSRPPAPARRRLTAAIVAVAAVATGSLVVGVQPAAALPPAMGCWDFLNYGAQNPLAQVAIGSAIERMEAEISGSRVRVNAWESLAVGEVVIDFQPDPARQCSIDVAAELTLDRRFGSDLPGVVYTHGRYVGRQDRETGAVFLCIEELQVDGLGFRGVETTSTARREAARRALETPCEPLI